MPGFLSSFTRSTHPVPAQARPAAWARPALLLLWPLLPLLAPAPAGALTLPPDFVAESLTPGQAFTIPTGLVNMPDGRILVTEKPGRVMVIQNGVKLSTPMWDGRTEILSNGDRGLTGIAVDPDYAVNRYIYLAYVVDPDSNGVDDDWVAYSRLTRFQTSLADPNLIDPATRTVFIGKDWADGIPSGGDSHTIDCLRFAPDGSLLVSAGDGGSYNLVDAGGLHGPIFFPGRVDPLQDIGAFRSQYLGTLSGKILRLNPQTGHGYVGNPYYDGNLGSYASRIWSYGLRNPFRFAIRPGTSATDTAAADPGTLYISETGWSTWEELNVARLPGQNFGWPCYEGPYPHPDYPNAAPAHSGCATIGTPANPAAATGPLLSWNHFDAGLSVPPGYRGNSSTGSFFYSGTLYPATWQGRVFFADVASDWLKAARVDANDQLVELQDFGDQMEGVVDMTADPVTGDILYASIYTGEVRRIRYTPAATGNQAPTAVASAATLVGVAPAEFSFSSAGSVDPDGDAVGYGWVFGDGVSVTGATPTHTFTNPGIYDVVLAARDIHGSVGRDTVQVIVNATAAFPLTPIRDTFDRADGPIGAGWTGDTGNYAIYSNTLRGAGGAGGVRLSGAAELADQEAYFTLYAIDPAAAYDLLLNLQGADPDGTGLRARYDPAAGEVVLTTFVASGPAEPVGAPLPATFAAGDQFGVRAYRNGVVEVYRNGGLIGTRSLAGWAYAGAGGGLGLRLVAGAPEVNDFGGGTFVIDSNTPPLATILVPADSSFYASGDTVHLGATFSDAQDPPDSLQVAWDVDLRHNNHIHPSIFHAATALAGFVAEDHDDGTGVHFVVNLHVQDRGGLTTARRVDIFPEVDLRPSPPSVTPAAPVQSDSLHWTFTIYNAGRMPAPVAHWRLSSDGTPFAEGDVQVAGQDSVTIVRHIPPVLSTGEHTITLSIDALAAVYETDEGNNTTTRALHIDDGVSGLPDGPLARLSLTDAYPNPTGAEVHWLLSLPAVARVDVRIFDIQGREIWSGEARDYAAGRWRLTWSGRGSDGRVAPSGIYMARIAATVLDGAPRGETRRHWTQRITRIR